MNGLLAVLLAVVSATNSYRAKSGLPVLSRDARLDAAAQAHSREMLKLRKLSHLSPDPGLRTPDKRASAAGVRWKAVGENVARYVGLRPTGKEIVNDWLHSAPHKAVLDDPKFRMIGVGAACGGKGGRDCFYTQMFAAE